MARDARRDPSQPDEQELLPAGTKRRPTLPFGMPAVRPGAGRQPPKQSESAARPRPAAVRPTPRPPSGYAEELPMRRDTPIGRRLGGFAPQPDDEPFLSELAAELRPHLAWLLGDRRVEFHRELTEGHLDVALEMLLEDRRANPRNVSATKAAHAMRDAIRRHVRDRVGPMDAVPFLVKDPPVVARSYVRVLPLVNGVSTIEDIIGSCQLPLLETIRALARLHEVGCIDIPGVDRPAARGASRSRSGELDFRHDSADDRPAASSRLTMPEILAPYAADLEALGVGESADLARAASGEHAVPASRADRRSARHAIVDPTTPVPDGGDDAAPASPRRASVDLDPASIGIADEATAPAPRIDDEATAPASRIDDETTAPASRIDDETTAPPSQDDDGTTAPVADAALEELGAIWRGRARTREPTSAPREDVPTTRRDAERGAASTHDASAVAEAAVDEPPAQARAGSMPSIPALEPPRTAPRAVDEQAPASRRSRPARTARDVRFMAVVAAAAGLVIVGMIALRFVRTAPEPAASAAPLAPVAPAPKAEAAPTAPSAYVAPPPADTAPSFIDRGTVTYTIKVTPKYARVFLDDVLLVPVGEVTIRREDRDHVLRAEAPGFATRALTVSARSDASLVIALDKAPGAAPAQPAAPRPKSPITPPTAPPPPPPRTATPEAPAQPYPD